MNANNRTKDKAQQMMEINKIEDPSLLDEMIDKAREDLNSAALAEYLKTGTLSSQHILEKGVKFEKMLVQSDSAVTNKAAKEKQQKKS